MFYQVFATTLTVVLVHFSRRYARARFGLSAQIRAFNVENADCWCCSVNHIDPADGKVVACDRVVITDAIKTWWEGGLVEFNQIVQGRVAELVEIELGHLLSFKQILICTM